MDDGVMQGERIVKSVATLAVAPNLRDYASFRQSFSWADARRELAGLPGGRGLNIAHEAVDRHADGPRANHLALRWLAKDGIVRDFTFAELARLSNRFANVLIGLGVRPGDRVYALTGRIPELYVAALGAWKCRAAFCTLFSAFGPEPLRARMALGEAKVLVTTPALYQKKVAPLRAALPHLLHVLVAGATAPVDGTLDFDALLQSASDAYTIPPTDPEDMALLHFTSGTTGTPKGAMHVHEAVRRASHDRQARARSASGRHLSGARPIRGGSPARRTASSRR